MVSSDVKIRLSLGTVGVLLFAVVLNAVAHGVLIKDIHDAGDIMIPRAASAPVEDLRSGINTLPRVNIAARDEKKEQGAQAMPPCITCPQPQGQIVYQQQPASGIFRPRTPLRPQPAPQPYRPNPQPAPQPAPQPPMPSPKPSADARPQSQYQLALFVNYDNASNQLLSWFDTHPGLASLKKNCQFQVYTPQNPMYKQRFASVIPAEAFPAVWFLKPDGGHVHLAAADTVPSTPDELYGDLKQGFVYAMDTSSAQKLSSSPPTEIDNYLNSYDPNCPDGRCPVPSPSVEPTEERRPLLFPNLRNKDKEKGGVVYDLFWGGSATWTLGLVIVLLSALCFFAMLQRMRG